MNDQQFCELLDKAPNSLNIQKYLIVTRRKLSEYRRIVVSYSGGSDSDIMLDLIELVKPEDCGEIKYIFFDTGLEWDATLRHLEETEQRYKITIGRIKSKMSIPVACKKYGVPFIAKHPSEMIQRLQKHGFNWAPTLEDAAFEDGTECKSAGEGWFYDSYGDMFAIRRFRLLKEFLISNPPTFAISDKCCDYAKKHVSCDFDKEFKPDLRMNGMRRAEGGRRTGSIKNCFTPQDEKRSIADYRPLWFWSDKEKQIYKEWRKIRYSDCYEKWGFIRTGCVGCPCSSRATQDLKIAEPYEQEKVKAAYAVFGKSYEYRERYNEFKLSYRGTGKAERGKTKSKKKPRLDLSMKADP